MKRLVSSHRLASGRTSLACPYVRHGGAFSFFQVSRVCPVPRVARAGPGGPRGGGGGEDAWAGGWSTGDKAAKFTAQG